MATDDSTIRLKHLASRIFKVRIKTLKIFNFYGFSTVKMFPRMSPSVTFRFL